MDALGRSPLLYRAELCQKEASAWEATLSASSLPSAAATRQQDFHGRTLLHWACLHCPTRLLSLLIDGGAVDAAALGCKTNAGDTPLHWLFSPDGAPLSRERGALAGRLVTLGALPKEENSAGQTPLALLRALAREGDEVPAALEAISLAAAALEAAAEEAPLGGAALASPASSSPLEHERPALAGVALGGGGAAAAPPQPKGAKLVIKLKAKAPPV